jgi:hypothetical protein
MTADNAYLWVDHLDKVLKIAKKSIKDVWIASLSATAGFMVERRKLTQNPFAGIRVRGTDGGGTNPSNKKGFSDPEVAIILEATLAVGPLPSDDAGDTCRPKVGALNLRLFGRARQRDHFPPSVGHTAGPETGICCIYLRREMIKRDYRRLSCE